MKKGPWTSEEDFILVNYINQNGHDNWRALPKRAGLMRCGKSCRLRWMNYLRPDIKRGNFTREEEETIVRLHQELGNRWSVIASKLPGRTDNEIKNVWHTNLKKKINKLSQIGTENQVQKTELSDNFNQNSNSPLNSTSENSSVDTGYDLNSINDSLEKLPVMDESFWSGEFSTSSSSDYTFESSSLDAMFSSDLSSESAMDFWKDILSSGQELVELPEFW